MTNSESMTSAMRDKLRLIPSLKGPFPDVDMLALPDTPVEAFTLWLDDALSAGIKEPHAMTLSTTDENGWPDARVLILKNVDRRGWHFAIKADSPKARQIEAAPHVALSFYWPALGRQIRLRGVAVALSAQECAEDFLGRPIGARIAALASKQSEVLENDGELEQRLSEIQTFLAANPDHVAPGWRVYAVAPAVAEFWQGASDRNHKRMRYVLGNNKLTWERLSLWP